jgi:hypothetical protein
MNIDLSSTKALYVFSGVIFAIGLIALITR